MSDLFADIESFFARESVDPSDLDSLFNMPAAEPQRAGKNDGTDEGVAPSLESSLLDNVLNMSAGNDANFGKAGDHHTTTGPSVLPGGALAPPTSLTASTAANPSPNQVVPLTTNASPPTFMLGDSAATAFPTDFSLDTHLPTSSAHASAAAVLASSLPPPLNVSSPLAASVHSPGMPTTPLTPVTELANRFNPALGLNTPTAQSSGPATPRAGILGSQPQSPYIGVRDGSASPFLPASEGNHSPFLGSNDGSDASGIPNLALPDAASSSILSQLNQANQAPSNQQMFQFLTQHFQTLVANNPALLNEVQKLVPPGSAGPAPTASPSPAPGVLSGGVGKDAHKKHRGKFAKPYVRRERPVRPKVVEAKGGVQCAGLNRKKNTQCRNAALMEYIGPRPIYCAEHIENDPNSMYMKCSAPYQKVKGDGKSCKEVVLKEFSFCYKHFAEVLDKLDGPKGTAEARRILSRVQDVLQTLESEAQAAKKSNADLYQRKNKLIPKFHSMKSLLLLKLQELPRNADDSGPSSKPSASHHQAAPSS